MSQTSFALTDIASPYLAFTTDSGFDRYNRASNAPNLNPVPPRSAAKLFAVAPTRRALDSNPGSLNFIQSATLQAVLSLLVRPGSGNPLPEDFSSANVSMDTLRPVSPSAHRLALDELDTISRTRAGYAFTELPADLQEAVLNLIATRDLTTPSIDLALWLEDLRRNPAAGI